MNIFGAKVLIIKVFIKLHIFLKKYDFSFGTKIVL